MRQLAAGFADARGCLGDGDFTDIKTVSAPLRFARDSSQKSADGCGGIRVLPKADQLRVMAIAAGFPGQHFLSEQSLAPNCHQAFGVKVPGVQSPESHLPEYICSFRCPIDPIGNAQMAQIPQMIRQDNLRDLRNLRTRTSQLISRRSVKTDRGAE